MKTWITYIAAILMGLATALLFGDAVYASGILSAISSFLVSLGIFITIPIMVFTLPSGIASLGKNRKGPRCALAVILWAIASAIVLSAAAAVVYSIHPVLFPVTSTAGSAPGALSGHVSYLLSAISSSLYPMNAFWSVATATYFIVPVIIISWILGLAIKPSADIIRPAYTVMNSFAEVMYRISRTYTVYGFFLAYASSASLFIDVYQEKTLFAAPDYAILLGITALVSLVIILPLLFALFTRFKKNPYRILYRSAASIITAFATGNMIASIPMNESIARQNNGVQKRVASVSCRYSRNIDSPSIPVHSREHPRACCHRNSRRNCCTRFIRLICSYRNRDRSDFRACSENTWYQSVWCGECHDCASSASRRIRRGNRCIFSCTWLSSSCIFHRY